jgi:hypothetical protein
MLFLRRFLQHIFFHTAFHRAVIVVVVVVVLMAMNTHASAQSPSSQNAQNTPAATAATADRYWLAADLGIGISTGRSDVATPNASSGITRMAGLIGLLRLQLTSHNFFSVGIETGLQHIVERQTDEQRLLPTANPNRDTSVQTSIRGVLATIPILLVLGGRAYNISVYASLGYFNLVSNASVTTPNGTSTVSSLGFDWGGSLSLGYTFPLPNDAGITIELRAAQMIDTQRGLISLQGRYFMPIIRF